MEFGASWFNVWITLTVFIEFYPEVPRVVIEAPAWTLKVSLDSNHSSLIGISFLTGFSRDVWEEQCLHKNKENPHTCTRACRYTWLHDLYSLRQQLWSTDRMGSSLSLARPSSIVTDRAWGFVWAESDRILRVQTLTWEFPSHAWLQEGVLVYSAFSKWGDFSFWSRFVG